MGCRPDGAIAGLPVRSFARLGQPLLAEELDGGLQILLARLERLLAVHHAGASPIAELFHQLRARSDAQASASAAAISAPSAAASSTAVSPSSLPSFPRPSLPASAMPVVSCLTAR